MKNTTARGFRSVTGFAPYIFFFTNGLAQALQVQILAVALWRHGRKMAWRKAIGAIGSGYDYCILVCYLLPQGSEPRVVST